MSGDKQSPFGKLATELRPQAIWELLKWLLSEVWKPAVIAGGFALFQKLRHVAIDWWAIMALFVLAVLSLFVSRHSSKKDLTKGRDDKTPDDSTTVSKAEHARDLERLKKQYDSDLYRAQEIGKQYKEEKHQAVEESRKVKELLAARDKEIQDLKPHKSANGIPIFNYAAIDAQRARTRFHNIDLRGEILELLYQTEYNFLIFVAFHVLINVRLTNLSDDVVTATDWKLRIDIGNTYWNGTRENIPDSMAIERSSPPDLFKATTTALDEIFPFPDAPLHKGIPQPGWLLFKVAEWDGGGDFPSCGQFTLFVADSFGNEHLIIQPCGRYISRGRISQQKP